MYLYIYIYSFLDSLKTINLALSLFNNVFEYLAIYLPSRKCIILLLLEHDYINNILWRFSFEI